MIENKCPSTLLCTFVSYLEETCGDDPSIGQARLVGYVRHTVWVPTKGGQQRGFYEPGEPTVGLLHTEEPTAGLLHIGEPTAGLLHTGETTAGLLHTVEPTAGLLHTGEPTAEL
jgi:hypothetical protein